MGKCRAAFLPIIDNRLIKKYTMTDDIDILLMGAHELISREELADLLNARRPLNVKAGFDPTAPDLHLGHMVLFKCLRQFQDAGHRVDFVIGDFTSMIGDPSGRNETRPTLSRTTIRENARTYERQIAKVLLPEKTRVHFNSSWLDRLSAADMIKLASQQTVARMLERDDFKKRYEAKRGIAIHEFLYPLVQAYDSVHLKSDIEFGGTDQKFNLLMGRSLQAHYGIPRQVVIMTEILEGLDGKRKMSKSLDNYIGIDEPPQTMFGKLMSVSDDLMWRYYELLIVRSPDEVVKLQQSVEQGRNPRDIKADMARELVTRFHGAASAKTAEADFIAKFRQRVAPDDIEEREITISNENLRLTQLLKTVSLTSSVSEGMRMVKAGAVRIDGEKVTDEGKLVDAGTEHVYQVGKRHFRRVRIKRLANDT